MKYYLIFINTLDGFEVVSISTFDDYESQQKAYELANGKLRENGSDWLGFNQGLYHKVQLLSEVR